MASTVQENFAQLDKTLRSARDVSTVSQSLLSQLRTIAKGKLIPKSFIQEKPINDEINFYTSYIYTIARAINQGAQFEYKPYAGEKLSYQELSLLKTINQISTVIQQIKDPKNKKRLVTLTEFREKIRTIIGLERIKIEQEHLAEEKRQRDLIRQKQEEKRKQLERAREVQRAEETRMRLEAERKAEQERKRLEEIRRKQQATITIQKRIRGNLARTKTLPKMEERKLAFIMATLEKIHEHLEKYKLIKDFLSQFDINRIDIETLEEQRQQILSLLSEYYETPSIIQTPIQRFIQSDQYKNLLNAIKRYNIDTMLAPPDESNPSLYHLNRYFETNSKLPNKYVGLSNEDLRKEKLKWIFEHRDQIDFDLLKQVFESHKTNTAALTADEIENPDILVITPESFKDFDAESTPILSPEKVRQNLTAEEGEGHYWTGAITRFKRNFEIIIALCNAVGGADNLTAGIIRDGVMTSFSTNGSSGLGISYDTWVNNIYYIGRTLVELQQIKHTKKYVYRDILTDLLIRLASAGGHCEYGLNDVNTIYDCAKILIPFSDSLATSTVLSVDDKVQKLLLSLRENVFKKVTTFETDTETTLTPLNYRKRFAERLGIAKAPEENHFAQTGSGRLDNFGNLITTTIGLIPDLREGHPVYAEIPLPQFTNLTNPEFLDRFFVGKHAGRHYPHPTFNGQNASLEYNKKYEGYSPYQIFLHLQKAVNNPELNDPDSVGRDFDQEFIREYCRTLPNTHRFVQSILRSNFHIKCYYKDNILINPDIDLADISAEDVKQTRDMLIKQLNNPDSAIATKQDLLVFGGYLFEERQTHGTRKFHVHDDIIIDYLAQKNIIVPIDVIPGYKFFLPSIIRN